MTPAENKQTVEEALDRLVAHDRTWEQPYADAAHAALRDLVAQADRAAELEAALRVTRKHLRPDVGGRFDQHAAVDAIDRALAGDGGGA